MPNPIPLTPEQQARWQVVTPEASPSHTEATLRALGGIGLPLDVQVARMTGIGEQTSAGLNNSGDLVANIGGSFKQWIEAERVSTGQLVTPFGIRTPELYEFEREGIDFLKLESADKVMVDLGYEPKVLFAPVLTALVWKQIYASLENNTKINHIGRMQNGGLYMNPAVEKNWDKLQANDRCVTIDGQAWQVLIMPTYLERFGNLSNDGKNKEGILAPTLAIYAKSIGLSEAELPALLHPAIPAYLTLQATMLQADKTPIDRVGQTWLSGKFGNNPTNSEAPIGYWDSGRGRVVLSWLSVGAQDGLLGVRLPVWGK